MNNAFTDHRKGYFPSRPVNYVFEQLLKLWPALGGCR
jgi:hypothetical protein